MAINERIHFRLIVCSHCNHQLCWVNPRLPSYCSECGKHIYPEVRSMVLMSDPDASIRYNEGAVLDAAEKVKQPPMRKCTCGVMNGECSCPGWANKTIAKRG